MHPKVILLTVIIICGSGAARAQDAAAGAAVFKTQCSICHSVVEGKNLVGPSLFGVVGRQAGQVSGFHYSPELSSGASVPIAEQLSFQPWRRGLNADEGGEHYFGKVGISDGTHRLPIKPYADAAWGKQQCCLITVVHGWNRREKPLDVVRIKGARLFAIAF